MPAMVRVPVRAAPELAAAVKLTVPLPVRLLPPLNVSQLLLLDTVHVHPLAVVTVVLPLPPAAPKLREVDDRLKLHGPACETVTVWPATVSVPVRAAPVFAATV
jgi:hypothetical protein